MLIKTTAVAVILTVFAERLANFLKLGKQFTETPEEPQPDFFELKKSYFKSAEWRRKQRQVKARDKHKCSNCGTYQNLKVIHLSGYEQIPNEPVSCLTTLCSKCRTQLYTALPKPQTLEQHYQWDAHNFKFKEPLCK